MMPRQSTTPQSSLIAASRAVVPRWARPALHRAIDTSPALARWRDGLMLRQRMRQSLGYEPDLRHPRTYNEKVAWKVLNDRNPAIATTADKFAVRDYVAARVGPDLPVPLIATFDRAHDIDWDRLPERFVMKASHGSRMIIVVPDKARADRDAILSRASQWLQEDYSRQSRAWGHRGLRRRILVERLLSGADGGIPEDYKYFVFHGRARILEVHLGRFVTHRSVLYDPFTLQPLPFRFGPSGVWAHETDFVPPPEVRGMAELAARLGEGFDHVRVDLYFAEGRPWFGEMTHYTGNACHPFDPPEYDAIVGAMWRWPEAPGGAPVAGSFQQPGLEGGP
jgi:TupA-like ATPgrasp